jgi:hypothetical protein
LFVILKDKKKKKVDREVVACQKEEASLLWGEKMSTFVGRARIEVQKNKEYLSSAIAEITSVMKRYAVDPAASAEGSKTPQEEFLGLVNDFCVDWKKARDDNVRAARMIEKMRAKTEQKKRDAMQKDEKKKRLMAAGKSNAHIEITSQVEDIMQDLRTSGALPRPQANPNAK